MQQASSVQRLYHGQGPQPQRQHPRHDDAHDVSPKYYGSSKETVPKLVVEEKEQEILAKEETISVCTKYLLLCYSLVNSLASYFSFFVKSSLDLNIGHRSEQFGSH